MQRQGPTTLEGATNHPNHCSKSSLYSMEWIALILFQSKILEKKEVFIEVKRRNRTNENPGLGFRKDEDAKAKEKVF